MKLLLTGFEPFGEDTVNPSEQIVRRLASASIDGVSLATAILPVENSRGPAELIRALRQTQPDAVLCLGVAVGRAAITVEKVAINLLDYRIADNGGNQIADQPVVPGGPAAYFTSLPLREIIAAMQAVGVPAELSLSAGSYLCNQVIYSLLHYLAENRLAIPAGFVHLPALPEQVLQSGGKVPSMSLETMTGGISAAIQAIRQAAFAPALPAK